MYPPTLLEGNLAPNLWSVDTWFSQRGPTVYAAIMSECFIVATHLTMKMMTELQAFRALHSEYPTWNREPVCFKSAPSPDSLSV